MDSIAFFLVRVDVYCLDWERRLKNSFADGYACIYGESRSCHSVVRGREVTASV
jgi:hypothetical protein